MTLAWRRAAPIACAGRSVYRKSPGVRAPDRRPAIPLTVQTSQAMIAREINEFRSAIRSQLERIRLITSGV